MTSRQFAHLHASSERSLRNRIPTDCPLMVGTRPEGGFFAATLDGRHEMQGRYQVVAAYIDGFIAAWRHITRRYP